MRITDNGLQYIDEVAITVLHKRLSTVTIPDITGDADTPVGHISFKLSSVRITSVSIPTSSFKTVAGVGLELKASGISLAMSGKWHYRKDHWPHISDSGSFDLSASGIAFSLQVKLGAGPKGHPTISAAGCSGSVGSVSIKFHGGASWLYNLFNKYVDGKIKDTIQSVMCKEATQAINIEAAKALASFPIEKAIDKYSLINYSLVDNPNFTATYADLFVKGEFMSVSHPTEAPFSPNPLPSSSESTQMAYVWLTDYVVNTAGLVYQKAGQLAKNVTSADLPANFSFPLNTKTFKLLILALYNKYPNLPMEFDLYATEPPHMESDTKGVSVTIIGNANADVIFPNGSKAFCFTLGLTILGTAEVAVKDGRATVHATFAQIKATLVNSAIGDISGSIALIELFLKTFAEKIIIHEINVYGDKGFPLPIIDGIELTNTKVTSGKHFNLIATDFKYTPPSESAVLFRKKRQARRKFLKSIPII